MNLLKRSILCAVLAIVPILSQATNTPTARAGIQKPAINDLGWGTTINSDFDIIDASMCLLSGANNFTGSQVFSTPISIHGSNGVAFYNLTNTASGSIRNVGNSGQDVIDIQALHGIEFNQSGLQFDPQFGGPTIGIYPSPFQTYGSFAVIGSSANSTQAYVGFQSTFPISQSTLWTLPKGDGTLNQPIVTDGSAHLSFATTLSLTSATFSGPIQMSGLSTNQCVQTNGSGQLVSSGGACGGGGGGGSSALQVTNSGVQVTSPTASMNFSTNFALAGVGSTSTVNIASTIGQSETFTYGVQGTTSTWGSKTSTSFGNSPYTVFSASGTSQAMQVNVNGTPSGGAQNMIGGITINGPADAANSNNSPALLVLQDSTTNSTNGAGLLEIWEQNSLHNEYLLWIHGASPRNSDEPIRFDGPTFGIDEVSLSTDSGGVHGLGKWKVISEAFGGVDLQIASNRAYDNTTFENLAYFHPLQKADQEPGLYLNPQSLADDSAVLASTDTSGINFFSLNSHTVGLTGPQNPTASYIFGLPDTVGSAGQLWYNSGNRGGNFNVRQIKQTGNDMVYSSVSGLTVSTLTVTSSATFTNITISGTCTGSGCGAGGGGGSSSLQVTQSGVQITSPTVSENFFGSDFQLQANGSTSTIALNPGTTDFIHNGTVLQTATADISSMTINGSFNTNGTVLMNSPVVVNQPGNGAVTSEEDFNSGPTQGASVSQLWYSGTGFAEPFLIKENYPADLSGTHYSYIYVDGNNGTTIIGSTSTANMLSVTEGSITSTPVMTVSSNGPVNLTSGITASSGTFGIGIFNTGINTSSITLNNQGNTRVVYMNGQNLGTTSTFTWNGTTMSATNVSGSTLTATTALNVTGPLGEHVSYGIIVGSMTASSATVNGVLNANSLNTATLNSPTGNITVGGSNLLSSNLILQSQGQLQFNDATNTNAAFIEAPLSVTPFSYSLFLPAAQGGASTVLLNDGSGNLSWAGDASLSSTNTWTAGQTFVSSVTVSQFKIISSTQNAYEMTSSTSTTPFHVAISTAGHFITNGPAPIISACGTTPSGSVVGDDVEGTISVGGGVVTSCTLTFASTWGTSPICLISDSSTASVGDISSISATAFTSSFSVSVGGGTIWYHCGCHGSSCL